MACQLDSKDISRERIIYAYMYIMCVSFCFSRLWLKLVVSAPELSEHSVWVPSLCRSRNFQQPSLRGFCGHVESVSSLPLCLVWLSDFIRTLLIMMITSFYCGEYHWFEACSGLCVENTLYPSVIINR